jgi:hypothetical protein
MVNSNWTSDNRMRPDVLVGFEGLEVDLVRLKKAERRVEVSLRRSEGKLRR